MKTFPQVSCINDLISIQSFRIPEICAGLDTTPVILDLSLCWMQEDMFPSKHYILATIGRNLHQRNHCWRDESPCFCSIILKQNANSLENECS